MVVISEEWTIFYWSFFLFLLFFSFCLPMNCVNLFILLFLKGWISSMTKKLILTVLIVKYLLYCLREISRKYQRNVNWCFVWFTLILKYCMCVLHLIFSIIRAEIIYLKCFWHWMNSNGIGTKFLISLFETISLRNFAVFLNYSLYLSSKIGWQFYKFI